MTAALVMRRWSLGVLVGYLTGRVLGHALAWADTRLARVTDLGDE